jgi:hypothetical protein
MGFASFSILMWEHCITFTEEVEYIWKGEKSPLVYLFLVNRYLTPFGFIVNFFAYLSSTWTIERCNHFIRFEGSMTIIGIEIVALMVSFLLSLTSESSPASLKIGDRCCFALMVFTWTRNGL